MTDKNQFEWIVCRAWAAVGVALALMRGQYYRWKFRLLRKRVQIGKRFQVIGRLDVQGPGTIVFGDQCIVVASRLAPVTPYTHAKEAVLKFGNRVVLNGTRFGCRERIEIGDDSVLADARVMDCDFHDVEQTNRHRWQTSGSTKPVYLGENVWVCAGAMILKGVVIGRNSVVGAGAVVSRSVPPNVLVAGNPARVMKNLSGIQSPQLQAY